MPDSNALILQPVHQTEDHSGALEAKAPKLSKSQLRKQKKVQEEHTKRQRRTEVLLHWDILKHAVRGPVFISKAAPSLIAKCRCTLLCINMHCQTHSMLS